MNEFTKPTATIVPSRVLVTATLALHGIESIAAAHEVPITFVCLECGSIAQSENKDARVNHVFLFDLTCCNESTTVLFATVLGTEMCGVAYGGFPFKPLHF